MLPLTEPPQPGPSSALDGNQDQKITPKPLKKVLIDTNKRRKKRVGIADKDSNEATTSSAESETQPHTGPNSFKDVVKTTMFLRNWKKATPSQIHTVPDVLASEVFEPALAVPLEEEKPELLVEVERLTGFEFCWAMLKRGFMKTVYFYIDTNGSFLLWWTFLVCCAFVYNCHAMVIFIFDDIKQQFFWQWLIVNVICDVIYVVDTFFMTRKAYIHDGMLVKNHVLTFKNYLKEPAPFLGSFHIFSHEIGGRIVLDILSMIPLDCFLYFDQSLSLLRIGRLLKFHRVLDFVERSIQKSRYPHILKIWFLVIACYIIFHWNACMYFLFSLADGLSEEDPNAFGFSYYKVFDPIFSSCDVFNNKTCLMPEMPKTLDLRDERPSHIREFHEYWKDQSYPLSMGNFCREYSMTIYWSSLTITKCGQQPAPWHSGQNMFEVVDTLFGVLLFATIIGSVGTVVTEMNQSVYEFRERMDGIKFYMKYRMVTQSIQKRVLECFMYMHQQNQSTDEKEIISSLPPRLQGLLAVHLHMETLKGVSLFRDCETEFLYEVILRLKQQIYSPDHYLCKVGDVAKEMYVVKTGTLQIVESEEGCDKDGQYLTNGDTFGEMSLINVRGTGESRPVSLRSIGYSDIYILTQEDISDILQEYPEARKTLIRNAIEWLEENHITIDHEVEEPHNVLSIDERLQKLKGAIEDIDLELTNIYTSFGELSTEMKRRVTSLEITVRDNAKKIRRDMMAKPY